jgi:hypothetical protein
MPVAALEGAASIFVVSGSFHFQLHAEKAVQEIEYLKTLTF